MVPESSLSLETQQTVPSDARSELSRVSNFFDAYSIIAALTTTLKKPNEGAELFQDSKDFLEERIKSCRNQERFFSSVNYEEMANYHSLLALVLWLCPNHPGFNRMRNASSMYSHAVQAKKFSSSSLSPSYFVALFVQLRVLPFLIRSNKPYLEELSRIREEALTLVSETVDPNKATNISEEKLAKDFFLGILEDGLGFSYFQLERDEGCALAHFERGIERLTGFGELVNGSQNIWKNDALMSLYNAMFSVAWWDLGHCKWTLADKLEGKERIDLIRRARADYEKSYDCTEPLTWNSYYKGLSAYTIASSYEAETEHEIDRVKVKELFMKAIKIGDEALRLLSLWSTYESDFLGGSWIATYYSRLANYSAPQQKRKYILRAIALAKRAEDLLKKRGLKSGRWSTAQIGDIFYRNSDYFKQLAISEKTAHSSSNHQRKGHALIVDHLQRALEFSLRSKDYYKEERYSKQAVDTYLLSADICHELLSCNLASDQKERYSSLGRRMCGEAQRIARRNEWNEAVAEGSWLRAQILDLEGKHSQSAKSYLEACDCYTKAKNSAKGASKIYQDFADYMLAWSKIQSAKIAHRSSKFKIASQLYLDASRLISQTREWHTSYQLFVAQSLIEKAELESLDEEKAEQSIEGFDKAATHLSQFCADAKTENSESRDLTLARQLIVFCKARVILEKSKQFYRIGDVERSVVNLSSAEAMFEELSTSAEISGSLRSNELKSMASLCNALKSFQRAQITGDSELYLEARKIFGRASEESESKSLKPLLSGLASFAAFLFYSREVEESLNSRLDLDLVSECNRSLENAEANFKKLGNKSFLNLLKASKQILEATILMNSADREIEDIQAKARLYSDAQRSLSMASRYYRVIGSSKRVKDALRMISAVRSHQRLIPLAHDLIAEIASQQIIHSAIASSMGIEQASHSASRSAGVSYIEFDYAIDNNYLISGNEAKISFTITNVAREPIIGVRIDEVLPEGFTILDSPFSVVQGNSLQLNTKIEGQSSKQFELCYKPVSSGSFTWRPTLIYLDSQRNYKIAKSHQARTVVEAAREDYSFLLNRKSDLDSQLDMLTKKRRQIQDLTDPNERAVMENQVNDEIYNLREKLSKIEEEFLRTINEYKSMIQEQEMIKKDLAALENDSYGYEPKYEQIKELSIEETLLQSRIERRRLQLEQAQLL